MTGSWLSGPSAALPKGEVGDTGKYRGERLGLPESGPGSSATTGRRVAGIFVDWMLCYGIALLLTSLVPGLGNYATVTLVLWAVVGVLGVWLFAFTPGQAMVGLGVARADAPVRVGLPRAFFRVLLTVFLIPALINDEDGRGLHDRATQTVVIRTR